MTSIEIEKKAAENHYVNNLIAAKTMWGLNAKIGILTSEGSTVRVRTVSQLVEMGLADPEFAEIDNHIYNLLRFQPNKIKQTIHTVCA